MTSAMPNKKGLQFFTICARNYIAQAACLAESLRTHHPESSLTIWLIDPGPLPPESAGLNCRHAIELTNEFDFMDLWFKYNITEFATALKPLAFLKAFAEGAEWVCYLDPDIYLFAPMDSVTRALENGAAGVLTPHMLAPYGRDGLLPSDRDINAAGIYNLGFCVLARGEATFDLLKWWWGWLQTDCYGDLRNCAFTDQKWMNFAPIFWDHFTVLKDKTLNVAYWNLHERNLERHEEEPIWRVDDSPLTFYHFSGFNPLRPGILSKHQNRFKPEPGTALFELLEFYGSRMMAYGFGIAVEMDFRAPTFDDGVQWDPISIAVFGDCVNEGNRFEHVLTQEAGSFRDFLQSGAYIRKLLELRPEIGGACGDDSSALLAWVESAGVSELSLEPKLISPASAIRQPNSVQSMGSLRASMEGDFLHREVARLHAELGRLHGIVAELADERQKLGEEVAVLRHSDAQIRTALADEQAAARALQAEVHAYANLKIVKLVAKLRGLGRNH